MLGGLSMKNLIVSLLVILALFTLGLVPVARAQAHHPSTAAVIGDVLVLRPLGFTGTVLGTTAFVVSLPVTWTFHNKREAEKLLVKKPFNYTFRRSLGK